VAVDPGASGAIAFLCGNFYTVVDIPTLKVSRGKGKKTVFDLPGIVKLFRYKFFIKDRSRVHSIVEVPPPSMGPKSSPYAQFRIGCAYAMWPLFLMSKGYSIEEVSPQKWKKVMGLSGKSKETSRAKAQGMFPKASLSRKKDHDRAEALLLATYLRRTHNGRL
jgi:crossover junction endodeoxyribonuclease RuvC